MVKTKRIRSARLPQFRPRLDIVDTLKLHAQPTVVLISTRSDEKLEEHLSKEARGIDRDDDSSMLPVRPYVTLLI